MLKVAYTAQIEVGLNSGEPLAKVIYRPRPDNTTVVDVAAAAF